MGFREELNIITDNSFLLKIFVAMTIIVGCLIIGKIVGKLLEKFIKKIALTDLIYTSTKIRLNLEKTVSTIISYLIYFFGFVWALDYLGLASTVLNLLSGAILILVLILAFLAFKDFVPNMTAGLFIHAKGFLKEGDVLKLHDIEGKIIYMSLVETRVKTKSGDVIFIPNSRLTRYEVIKRK